MCTVCGCGTDPVIDDGTENGAGGHKHDHHHHDHEHEHGHDHDHGTIMTIMITTTTIMCITRMAQRITARALRACMFPA